MDKISYKNKMGIWKLVLDINMSTFIRQRTLQ